jgi:peptidoglycan/LPS O-acetylase OafA/YrhL
MKAVCPEKQANSVPWQNPRLTGRIPELDGVRGLAILLVLVWHYFQNGFGGVPIARGAWQAYSFAMLRLTWSGVDLFFVLSGFLIGGILLDAKTSDHYYRTFYVRRMYRISPLYFLWMALFVVGLYYVSPPGRNST